MNVSIIGTGNMARALGTRLLASGHDVTIVSRSPERGQELADELGGSAQAADAPSGDVVVLAVYHSAWDDVLARHGDALDGRVVIDHSNPVTEDFSGLVDTPAGSAAQELAARVPGARVVKAFNTTFANTLVEGKVDGQPLDVFLAADDDEAKATVAGLVEDGGMNALDAGPLASARYVEAAGFLHISLQSTLGTGFASALKVIRP
jgi:8-hydroxy-5-deazaflavin:NADPH oxidoreductase